LDDATDNKAVNVRKLTLE